MHTAGVVADHPAEGAPGMGGRIGAVHQAKRRSDCLQVVENQTGLNACDAALRIDLEDLPQVLRHVEDDRDVAALSGQACAGAAGEAGDTLFAADSYRVDDLSHGTRDDDGNGHLTVVRGVGGVQGAGPGIEGDGPFDGLAKSRLECADAVCGELARVSSQRDLLWGRYG